MSVVGVKNRFKYLRSEEEFKFCYGFIWWKMEGFRVLDIWFLGMIEVGSRILLVI